MRLTMSLARLLMAVGAIAGFAQLGGSGAAAQATPEAEMAVNCLPPLADGGMHPYAFPQPDDRAEGFWAVIEIPAGSFTKYEVDSDTGQIIVDRFQSMPVAYPANYGSIPQSAGGDGDPLDVLVLTRAPLDPGVYIRVRPIGMLNMIDGGEVDDKVVAVPVSDVDPQYDDIASIEDLPLIEQQRIEGFFRVYKELPEGRNEVELDGFEDVSVAAALVDDAIGRYQGGCPAS
jgi:inorganic pyrophosphatase